jgi:hypothetical protein
VFNVFIGFFFFFTQEPLSMKHGGQLCEHLKSHEQSDNEQQSGKRFWWDGKKG